MQGSGGLGFEYQKSQQEQVYHLLDHAAARLVKNVLLRWLCYLVLKSKPL